MSSHRLAALFLLTAFAATAQRLPVPGRRSPCHTQPGAPITAEISVTINDREVRADSGIARIDTVIPMDSRVTEDGRRLIATLPPVRILLRRDTLKHFDLIPTVIIEAYQSPACQVRLEPGIANRNWAADEKTNFNITAVVTLNGRRETFHSGLFLSCFDQDTRITLASGERVAVKNLVPGDRVRNPVTHAAVTIEQIVRGTQADETLYRIGYAGAAGLFTGQHPIRTSRGLIPAREITASDSLLGEDALLHPVTVFETQSGQESRSVYNLKLKAASDEAADHLLSAEGIVAGDFFLQQRLNPPQLSQARR